MAKKPLQEDLFEGTSMSFGEHLEELRICLFRAIIGVAIGCGLGFYLANDVVNFFQSPLESAMKEYYIDKATEDLQKSGEYGDQVPPEVLRLVLDDRKIPETMYIESGKLIDTLKSNYPSVFGSVRLSQYQFQPADLTPEPAAASTAIAKKIVSGKNAQPETVEFHFWTLLTPTEQKTIEAIATSKSPASIDQTNSLLGILNRQAARKDVVSGVKSLIEQLPTEDQTIANLLAKQVATGTPLNDDVIHLNRLLFGQFFDGHVREARVNLIPITTWKDVKVRFQVLNAQEAFMIWMKAGLVSGLVIASPWVFLQIWNFVAAGLYPHEKSQVYVYMPISMALFLGGATLAFVFVFEPVLSFLFTFNRGMNADFDPRIGEWLSFVLILPIGFGVSFQLPLVMLFLNRLGLVSIDLYIQQWRIAIMTIAIVSMILTPADPISMTLMAGPLVLLYFLGIAMCKYMPRGRSPFQEVYEP